MNRRRGESYNRLCFAINIINPLSAGVLLLNAETEHYLFIYPVQWTDLQEIISNGASTNDDGSRYNRVVRGYHRLPPKRGPGR